MQKILAEEREKSRRMLERKEGETAGLEGEKKGVLEKIWMGDEKEGWRERRIEEEKKALEEGKTFSDMIYEQIWDVWNWDKKKRNGDDGKKE